MDKRTASIIAHIDSRLCKDIRNAIRIIVEYSEADDDIGRHARVRLSDMSDCINGAVANAVRGMFQRAKARESGD